MKKVVIIGAGIGGLTAANLLAKKGYAVTLLEGHNLPGGYTAGFYRKGCYFESGTVCFESIPTIRRAMQDIGILDQLEFIKFGMRIVSDQIDGCPENYQEVKRLLYTGFPGDKASLDRAFAATDRVNAALATTLDAPLPSVLSRTEMFAAMLRTLPSLAKIIKVSRELGDLPSSEFAARYFPKDSPLFNLFSWFSYPDMSAVLVATALSGVFTDTWTVKGGLQSWANRLADRFREQGGNLLLKSHVDRIVTKDGVAAGVVCQKAFYPGDYVIAACDYKKTFLKLLDDPSLLPPGLEERIAAAAVSAGFFTVYLVLGGAEALLRRSLQHAHVYNIDFKPGYDIYAADDPDFFAKTAFYVYSQSLLDPTLAPAGRSSLMIQCRVPHRWMNNWGAGDRDVYTGLKEQAMQTLIERAALLVPGLPDYIQFQDAATPLTYERYTENSDGATSAWSWDPRRAFFKDAISTNVTTPIPNLLIGSCWAMQVGGVPGAISAAYECVKKIH